MASRLVMRQTLRYDYPSPVSDLRHHLMVLPPARHGDQVAVAASVEVWGAPAEVTRRTDAFGNVAVEVWAPRVAAAIEFDVAVTVERRDGPAPAIPAAEGRRLLVATELTGPSGAMRRAARRLAASGDAGVGLAQRVNAFVAASMEYRHDVTGVRTNAAEAFDLGAGVCQDYAHVMVALCRLCGLPARYVSGHMLGEGGSHAWVEVLLPAARRRSSLVAVAFDPTNDRLANAAYLTVATGRDYADVAPTHGSYRGPAGGVLTVRKSLESEAVVLVAC